MYSEHYLQDTSHACPNGVVLLQSPPSDCMLPFADPQLDADHELKGGGVALPRGPSIKKMSANSKEIFV
jgi:hypothetical protein